MTSSSCSRLKVQDKTKSTTQKWESRYNTLEWITKKKVQPVRYFYMCERADRHTNFILNDEGRNIGPSEETETFLPCGKISKNWSTDFRPVMNLQDPIRPSKEFIFHGIPWNTKKKLFYQILRQHSIYDHKDFNQTFHYATAWKNVLRKCWVRVRRACAQFNTWIISLHNQLSSLKG